MTTISTSQTRSPKLTRAVLRALGGRDSLEDICRHGISGGFAGFTYYADTLAFFKRNKADIMALAESQAEELGTDMLTMIAGFNCLKNEKLTGWQICQALNGKGDDVTNVQNAMAWYGAEEVARELCPDI
jgi:hypothetical protein